MRRPGFLERPARGTGLLPAVVGNGLRSRFDCVFDYGGKALYLRPNSRAGGAG